MELLRLLVILGAIGGPNVLWGLLGMALVLVPAALGCKGHKYGDLS
jgi:hypothetical protein